MATAPIEALKIGILEDDIELLVKELEPLKAMMAYDKMGMYITHDGENIVVLAPLKYKAYIPKKYNGWQIVFVEDMGNDQLDLDIKIHV